MSKREAVYLVFSNNTLVEVVDTQEQACDEVELREDRDARMFDDGDDMPYTYTWVLSVWESPE